MNETMIPAACTRCGMPVLWVRRTERAGAGFYPPLDGASSVKRYALTPDARLHFVDTYVVHNCTPGVTEPELALAAAEPTTATHALTEQTGSADPPQPPLTPAQISDRALQVNCLLCGAEIENLCYDLYQQALGNKVGQYWVHDTRKVIACPEQYSEDEAIRLRKRDQQRLTDAREHAHKNLEQAQQRRAQHEAIVANTRCTECWASRGVKCWNLALAARGIKKHNANPHAERRALYLEKKQRQHKK